MGNVSKKNLFKLYVDEGFGGNENKFLSFQVKDMLEAGKVYLAINKKVRKIKAAYFQNGLINGISTRITEEKASKLNEMYLELKEANK